MRLFCILHRHLFTFFRVLNPCVYLGPGVYMSPAFIWINTIIQCLMVVVIMSEQLYFCSNICQNVFSLFSSGYYHTVVQHFKKNFQEPNDNNVYCFTHTKRNGRNKHACFISHFLCIQKSGQTIFYDLCSFLLDTLRYALIPHKSR